MLLLLPFWVSELVRVYGWMIFLRESGVINHFLLKAGLLKQPIEMLYNDVTMVMGLVYTCMLFMVIPLVSVLDSLDATLPINLYLQVRDGSTPVINAISFLLIIGTSTAAVANLYFSKKER
jgi:hypothetical protein